MVSEARDEMKRAFINTQSNTISNRDLAWRPALLRVHATDTTVKRVLGANVHDTGRDGSKRSSRGANKLARRDQRVRLCVHWCAACPKWPMSSDLSGVVRLDHHGA